MKRRGLLTVCLALCLAITVLCAVILVACNSIYTSHPHTSEPQRATSFVRIDVNPSVELVLDQNDVVMSAYGANRDGKVLLFEESGIVGAELDVALGNIASCAVRYGYVKDDANVSVEVVSEKADDVFEKISKKFTSAVENADESISVRISNSCDFVLENELETLKAQHPENQAIQNLDIATYRLVQKAVENGLALDEALSKTTQDLITKANELQSDLTQKFDDTYKDAVNRAQFVFDSATQTIENAVCVQYFYNKLADAFAQSPIGSIPMAKQTLAAAKLAVASASKLSLEFYRSCQNALIANPVYSLSANDVESMASLPVDVADSLVKDYMQDGKIVIDKDELNSLFNTSYRNCDDRTDFAKAYQTALNCFTNFATYDKDDYSLATKTALTVAEHVKTSLEKAQALLGSFSSFSFDLENFISDYTADVDYTSSQAVQNAINYLQEKCDEATADIAATQEDKQAIQRMLEQSEVVKALSEARSALDDALAQAKTDAYNLLLAQKDARKTND